MVFTTRKMENVMSMYDERVAELESLLEASDARYVEVKAQLDRQVTVLVNREERYASETNILARMLNYTYDNCCLEQHHLDDAIASMPEHTSIVRDVLEYHDAVPAKFLEREYYVSITVPVTVCITVKATDEDSAEEQARDDVESNGIEYFDMEYNTYYDAEYSVTEA
jgi:hypothetical protein